MDKRILISAIAAIAFAGPALAELPKATVTPEQQAQAAVAKEKAAAAAKKEAEDLARVEDTVAERYKKMHGEMTKAGGDATKK